nr:glycosyltransferase [uncultured Bacteroides sp.]
MRKKVYLCDEYVSSQKNGIGSFIREFLHCMKQIDVEVCMLVFNANVEEFTLSKEEEIEKMLFPPFMLGDFMDNAEIVGRFLKIYIPDSSDNVFFINHSPCETLMNEIRKVCPLSKLVFTIHDMGWTSAFTGDVDEFKKIACRERVTEKVDERQERALSFYNEEKRMYALVDRVVCLSKDTFNLLQDTYCVSLDKIALIPNGLRLEKNINQNYNRNKLRRELFISPNDKILLFAGRPTLKKGMYTLLEALGLVLEKEPDARLVITGFDNETNMKNLIAMASAFATRVTFVGLINKEQLYKWYTVADIGVIPSYYEQCSYTGIEMMMHGLPIVASDGYGLRNMFCDGVNARIAKIGNRENKKEFVQNIATAILDILASKKLAQELNKGAELKFKSTYHIHDMEENYRRLLNTL